MTEIPSHVRRNYEATDKGLNELRGLLLACDHLAEAATVHSADPASDALMVLLELTHQKLRQVEHARTAAWVGLGGSSTRLTEQETAAARGVNVVYGGARLQERSCKYCSCEYICA
ncbi:hypothetical protein [Roseovarius salinarum]|uniref:hypothetical protein n=1 Tax=Roseovarius salinarum TaxID=1981892 RepID=UPI000C31BB85|nr:hypothetical protein [Roseovarius salinarum]